MTFNRDVAQFEFLDEETGEPKREDALCIIRIGEWCILRSSAPLDRPLFFGPPCWEPDDGFSVTHTASGRRGRLCGELWRAIIHCEEFDQTFRGRDPMTIEREEANVLGRGALARAAARIERLEKQFGFARLNVELPVDDMELPIEATN